MRMIALSLLAVLGLTAASALVVEAAQKKGEPQWIKQFWEDQSRRGGW